MTTRINGVFFAELQYCTFFFFTKFTEKLISKREIKINEHVLIATCQTKRKSIKYITISVNTTTIKRKILLICEKIFIITYFLFETLKALLLSTIIILAIRFYFT